MKTLKIAAFALLALAALAEARDRPFVDEASTNRDDVGERTPWKEGSHALPPYPKEGDLVEFQVDTPGKGLRYYVDGEHLSVGEDNVVRYTLVIKSRTGASNVSFEGMRCNHWDFKTYAFGGGRGKLSPLENPDWEPIRTGGQYRHHMDLHEFYFCKPLQYIPFARDEILRRMQTPVQRVEDTGFF